jgi:hypothetical protein
MKKEKDLLRGLDLCGFSNVDGFISRCISIKPVNDFIQPTGLDGILYYCFGDSWKPQISIDFLYNVKEVMRLARMDAHESRLSWKLIFHNKYFIWYAVDGLATVMTGEMFFLEEEKRFFLACARHTHQKRWGVPPAQTDRGWLLQGGHNILLHIKKPIPVSSYFCNKLDILGAQSLGKLARGLYAPTYTLQ